MIIAEQAREFSRIYNGILHKLSENIINSIIRKETSARLYFSLPQESFYELIIFKIDQKLESAGYTTKIFISPKSKWANIITVEVDWEY